MRHSCGLTTFPLWIHYNLLGAHTQKNKIQIIPYGEFSHMKSFSIRNFLYGEWIISQCHTALENIYFFLLSSFLIISQKYYLLLTREFIIFLSLKKILFLEFNHSHLNAYKIISRTFLVKNINSCFQDLN